MKRTVLALLAIAALAAIGWVLIVSSLTPITRTETHAEWASVQSADKVINRHAPEGWQVSQYIYWKDIDAITILFTRQVPWYAPPMPTTTPVPTMTPAPR